MRKRATVLLTLSVAMLLSFGATRAPAMDPDDPALAALKQRLGVLLDNVSSMESVHNDYANWAGFMTGQFLAYFAEFGYPDTDDFADAYDDAYAASSAFKADINTTKEHISDAWDLVFELEDLLHDPAMSGCDETIEQLMINIETRIEAAEDSANDAGWDLFEYQFYVWQMYHAVLAL